MSLKIQANMNKAHRDRIAFMRICSGKFEASEEVCHVQGDRKMRLSQPQQMMAPGPPCGGGERMQDIIGVFDPVFSQSAIPYAARANPVLLLKEFRHLRRSILPESVRWIR